MLRTAAVGGGAALVAGLLLFPASTRAQSNLALVPGGRLLPGDEAVLTDPARRQDLPCEVSPTEAEMGFDLQYHAGYDVRVPLKELKGEGARLRVLARVTPLEAPANAAVLAESIAVPPITPRAGGEAELSGEYVVGPGKYRVDFMIRAGPRRVCSAHWRIDAHPWRELQEVALALPADTVGEAPQDPFRQSSVARKPDASLYLKILVNFSPAESPELLSRADVNAITSILRSIAREPRFGRFSVVAFSTDHQSVLYRQPPAPRIDFPALGKALKRLRTGTVAYSQLRDPDSATDFLGRLLAEEIGTPQAVPDAIVIVGPKVEVDWHVRQETLVEGGRARCPVFYLYYNPNPFRYPWSDPIQAALKFYRGLEYSITQPHDLGKALNQMTANLVPKR